ncbi:MAG: sel1 repeat family protein [Tenacibaculum sp.]|nr:sel1 repeat family protein [Tenacibaculum sp.]
MSKYLRDIVLYTNKEYSVKPKEYYQKIHFVYIQKLNYLLNKIEFNGILTINLVITDIPSEHLTSERFGNILEVFIFFIKENESKNYVISYYSNLLIHLSKLNDCYSKNLIQIINKIIDIEEVWAETISRRKWNKSKTFNFTLSFEINYLNSNMKFFLNIENKQKQRKSILFSEVSNSLLVKQEFEDRANKVYWENDDVIIIEKSKKSYWEYNTNTGELTFHFYRAESGDAHGQYDLGLMYFKGQYVLKDKKKAKYWFNKSAEQNYSKAIKMLKNNFANDT